MADFDPKLVTLATSAVSDPAHWGRVLDHIMIVTGAPAAMITLRDKRHCQIVNDDALEREHHSPLIRGFPNEVVEYYLNELRTIDPWAEAQIVHYPMRPTLMSTVCSPDSVNGARFFGWLNALGIFDTIAFELEVMPDYWTACNFFLTNDNDVGNVLEFANKHHDLLRTTWQTSQKMVRSNQLNTATLEAFGQMDIPACIIDGRDALVEANGAFKAVLETDEMKLIGTHKTLSIGHDTNIIESDDWGAKNVARHDSSVCLHRVSVQSIHPDPLFKGKKKKYRILTLQKLSATTGYEPKTFDLERLDRIQRKLFYAVKGGMSVGDASKTIGYSRAQTFKIWADVKSILSITSAHQLR